MRVGVLLVCTVQFILSTRPLFLDWRLFILYIWKERVGEEQRVGCWFYFRSDLIIEKHIHSHIFSDLTKYFVFCSSGFIWTARLTETDFSWNQILYFLYNTLHFRHTDSFISMGKFCKLFFLAHRSFCLIRKKCFRTTLVSLRIRIRFLVRLCDTKSWIWHEKFTSCR